FIGDSRPAIRISRYRYQQLGRDGAAVRGSHAAKPERTTSSGCGMQRPICMASRPAPSTA
ncbi:MAG TPA: hypothetical protein VJ376_07095, partial [Pseudomonadota bacterium]|nr:hypothetical protein [Pseudomonadota bacterium]